MIVRGHAVGLLLAVVARCLAPGVSPFGYASAANKDVNSGSGRHEVGDSEKICEMAAELVNTMRKAGALGKEVARHVEEASAAKERSRSLRLRSEAAVQDANDAAESTSVYGISGSAGGEKAKRVFLRVDAAFEGFRKAARTVSALVSLVLERAATAELKINETEKLAQTEVNNTLSLLDAAAKEVTPSDPRNVASDCAEKVRRRLGVGWSAGAAAGRWQDGTMTAAETSQASLKLREAIRLTASSAHAAAELGEALRVEEERAQRVQEELRATVNLDTLSRTKTQGCTILYLAPVCLAVLYLGFLRYF